MSTHTQGKLCVSSNHPRIIKTLDFMGESDVLIASSHGVDGAGGFPTDAEALHNARRLVAAWNACDGLTTGFLEDVSKEDPEPLKTLNTILTKEADELKAQRDELLAALKFYADESRYRGPNQVLDAPDPWSEKAGLSAYRLDVTRDRGVIALAAIARAEVKP